MDLNKFIELDKNNSLNVFVVNNNVTAIITALVIDKFNLENDNVLVISMRNSSTSLFENIPIKSSPTLFDRIQTKLIGSCPQGTRLKKIIEKHRREFFLYAPWSMPEVNKMLESNFSMGHIYIEEGQLSYRNSKPYTYVKPFPINPNFFNKYEPSPDKRTNYFRNDSLFYIALDKLAFPMIARNQKLIINNFTVLKSKYKPKLIGHQNIGITCATRRLKEGNWGLMIEKLLKSNPEISAIKLHPSFTINPQIKNKIKNLINNLIDRQIHICSDDVIIELEMLHERKNLFGSLSSLTKYSKLFGSNYININLY